MTSQNSVAPSRLTRRTALKGAAVAAGVVWVAPVIQIISMESAAAASAPPARVHSDTATRPLSDTGASQAASALPKTGADDSTTAMATIGAGAVVVGVAAVAVAKRWRADHPADEGTHRTDFSS